jgi:hypothetical protein
VSDLLEAVDRVLAEHHAQVADEDEERRAARLQCAKDALATWTQARKHGCYGSGSCKRLIGDPLPPEELVRRMESRARLAVERLDPGPDRDELEAALVAATGT